MTKTEIDLKTGKKFIRCPHDLSRMYHLNSKVVSTRYEPGKAIKHEKITETYQCTENRHRITIDADTKVTDLVSKAQDVK